MVFALALGCAVEASDQPLLDGDLIFHASQSDQSTWIRLATGSSLTHVGLVDLRGDEVWVIEAVQPVKATRLRAFRDRWGDPRIAVKRREGLTPRERDRVVAKARSWLGGDYDSAFGWGDDRVYCSELVWKAYAAALDVELAAPGTFADYRLFDLPIAAEQKRRRWGEAGPDPAERIVSPADLWRSDATTVVLDQLAW